METLLQDLRYGLRMLAKSPGFTSIAILTLALSIGANTALFSVVNGVLLNPLPYLQPRQLVAIYGKTSGVDQGPISYLNFLDWQRDTKTFSCMAMYRNEDHIFTGTGEAERLSGYMISADFFSTLGVQPILGRTFRPEDDQPDAAPVALLSRGFWKRKFGSSPDVVGKSIILDGQSYKINAAFLRSNCSVASRNSVTIAAAPSAYSDWRVVARAAGFAESGAAPSVVSARYCSFSE
jgi:MacB-like periplasmic core domain